jgi:hypothetical protein
MAMTNGHLQLMCMRARPYLDRRYAPRDRIFAMAFSLRAPKHIATSTSRRGSVMNMTIPATVPMPVTDRSAAVMVHTGITAMIATPLTILRVRTATLAGLFTAPPFLIAYVLLYVTTRGDYNRFHTRTLWAGRDSNPRYRGGERLHVLASDPRQTGDSTTEAVLSPTLETVPVPVSASRDQRGALLSRAGGHNRSSSYVSRTEGFSYTNGAEGLLTLKGHPTY